jgi:predicted amidohydrolase YtcJ
MVPDTILYNGKIATNGAPRFVEAVAIEDGKITAIGTDGDVLTLKGQDTKLIDLKRHTVIPGLNDSHIHTIRGGLNFNMELRWDGVPSLADALSMLREQALRTAPPQWVRVVGGWNEFQFAERRMPTIAEINEASPEVPVFVLHLYDRAWLNGAALRAVGYTKGNVPSFPAGEVEYDSNGNPTGMIIAKPNANILYSTLAKGPKLSHEDQLNSTRLFMRELNRFGITSTIDAGGGFQNFPDDYEVINELHKSGDMSLRIEELEAVVRHLAEKRWPVRLHATYDETISHALNVYERVNRDVPLEGLHWFFDHCETVSERNLERIKALGGGIAIQNRMAFQGEYFVDRYGKQQAAHTPPIRKMLELEIPVGAGTDATRVSSYNPFLSLYWLITGKTVGGLGLYPQDNRMSREEALRLYTVGSSWFSTEDGKKGSIAVGQLADLAVLSADFFTIPEEDIRDLESVLTVTGGKVVYAAENFEPFAPPSLPVSPDWSPVKMYGGYANSNLFPAAVNARTHQPDAVAAHRHRYVQSDGGVWSLGCDCFAF